MGTEIFQFRLLGAEKMGFKVSNPMSEKIGFKVSNPMSKSMTKSSFPQACLTN